MCSITDEKSVNEINEKKIWFDFYMEFSDNNLRHACRDFDEIGFSNDIELHQANLTWIRTLFSSEYNLEEIEEVVPDAKPLIIEFKETEEYKEANRKKEEEQD